MVWVVCLKNIQKQSPKVRERVFVLIRYGFLDIFKSPVNAGQRDQMTRDRRTVFVVDDEDMLRSLTCDIIEGEGFNVISARNGREALEIFKVKQHEVGLVILDMSMPEMDGNQTFRALRKIDPTIKVLVSSGFTEDPVIAKMIDDGAHGVIAKPFRVDDLTAKVRGALGG